MRTYKCRNCGNTTVDNIRPSHNCSSCGKWSWKELN